MKYEGEVCPYCGNLFAEGDDVVVCPECAAPHHRACWFAHGHCANEALHGTGFVWKKMAATPKPEQADQPEPDFRRNEQGLDIICPDCGKVSPNGTLRCPDCGALLVPFAMGEPPIAQFRPGFDPNETVYGMKSGDVALYCRTGGSSYINKCRKREFGKKLTFNWAALLFGPFWFFYRKLYKPGAILLGLSIALTLFAAPYAEQRNKVSEQMLEISRESFGEPTAAEAVTEPTAAEAATEPTAAEAATEPTAAEAATEPTAAEAATEQAPAEQFGQKMYDLINRNRRVLTIVGAINLANLFLFLFAALTADSFYIKKMKRDIETVRKNNSDERTVQTLLFRKGGVSLLGAAGAFFGCQLAFMLFDYLS